MTLSAITGLPKNRRPLTLARSPICGNCFAFSERDMRAIGYCSARDGRTRGTTPACALWSRRWAHDVPEAVEPEPAPEPEPQPKKQGGDRLAAAHRAKQEARDARIAQYPALIAEGLTGAQMAERLGVHFNTVTKDMRLAGLSIPRRGAK